MSFILDALRRSDAERRLGETPTLGTAPVTASGPPAPEVGPLVWVLAGVISLALLVLGWSWFRSADELLVTTPPVADSRVVETAAPEPEPALTSNPQQAPAGRAVSPVAEYEAPAVTEPEPEPEPAVAPQPEPQTEPQPEPREVQQPARQVAEVTAPPRNEPIHRLELPPNIRQQLPPFNVAVQVYDEQPEARFAIIGGERYYEGEELRPGLKLVEIRRQGLVFTYRNYRFLVAD